MAIITKAQVSEIYDTLKYMVSSVVILHGQMGAGKSTCATGIAYWMRELFDLPVVSIATSMELTENFGPSTHLTLRQFIEQLQLMSAIADEILELGIKGPEATEAYLAFCKQTRGLVLHRAVLLADELQKTSNARASGNAVNMALLEFVDQMRHYHCTLIGMTPRFMNIDVKLREQTKWQCRPEVEADTKTYSCVFRGPQGKLSMTIDGRKFQGRYPDDPKAMFNSWAFTGFNFKRLEKVLEKQV
jgi:hypothetical protein